MIREAYIKNSLVWDNIVRSFLDYDVFYLSGYSRAFVNENPENGTPILLLYKDGNDRAVNVIFKRDVALDKRFSGRIEEGKYFDIITPYGYGGFWGNITNWDKLNKEYNSYCVNNGFISEFVRFELFSDYFIHYDGVVETRTHNVVRTLNLPLDEMWMDFKQKVRKNVNKAKSFNLSCIIENNDEHLDDFLRIYYSTMERTGAEGEYYFSRSFFEDISLMKDNIMFFYVLYEGKIISTELVIYGSDNCYSYLGGTDRDYFDVRPNDYLKYEIIKWAKDKGLKNFVLGGGYGKDDGIYQYKQGFAPHGECDFYIGKKIIDKAKYNELCDIRGNIESNFFPLYRACSGGGYNLLIYNNLHAYASQVRSAA